MPTQWSLGVAATTLALAAAASGCQSRLALPTRLVFITLDTTRADRLPAYGNSTVTTPALDRLAHDGAVFDEAESVAPLTLTAHSSLFTGLYPPHHGVRDNADPPLDAKFLTLAEILHARGFRTAAFVGSIVLAPDRGLARGFDVYSDGNGTGVAPVRRRSANLVVDEALKWLDDVGPAPFFLWVHLYDAHAPRKLPSDHQERYGGNPYDCAIAFMDSQIGRLLDRLDQNTYKTAIVVVGDHGESLGDHGELEHGIFLYESALHVPLIVRGPNISPQRITDLTSVVDILPTVLELMHLPPQTVDGVSLLPALQGRGVLPERGIYAESMYPQRFGWSPLRMLRDRRFKLIDAPRPELYDLENDPFESRDVARERTAVARAMQSGLRAMLVNLDDHPGDEAPATPARVEPLAALGYVSGTSQIPSSAGRDPKDAIDEYNAITRRRAMR